MNKQTIITILLALVAILSVSCVLKGQGNETKSAETKPKYATEQKKTQDDAVLTYGISSLQDSASLIILVIREYNQLGMVNEMKGQRLNGLNGNCLCTPGTPKWLGKGFGAQARSRCARNFLPLRKGSNPGFSVTA